MGELRVGEREPVRPGLRDLLRILEHTVALVLGRRPDVLASNRMAVRRSPTSTRCEPSALPADPDYRLSVCTAEADSSSEEVLRLPAAWIRQPEASHGQHADLWTPAAASPDLQDLGECEPYAGPNTTSGTRSSITSP